MASLIALAGFMGSGKSSVGTALAQMLEWDLVDLDEEIERSLGVAISEFFTTDGETAFREVESEVLRSVLERCRESSAVLALGGGTLDSTVNRTLVADAGSIVFLDVSSNVAWHRVMGSQRPLAQDEEAFVELWKKRRGLYDETADWVMPTEGRSIDEIAGELRELVRAVEAETPGLWARRLCGTSRPSLILGAPGAMELLREHAATAAGSGTALHVITDSNVWEALGERVLSVLGASENDVLVVDAGETSKSAAVLARCWEWMGARNARRQDTVVAVGGGVVGDLGGFVAATYHRGVKLWQVPTSLLAQVDSSVGGKTAINLTSGKNLVGAFHQPDMVVIDPLSLVTLPDREYIGALGEVVKHALLSSPEALRALEEGAGKISQRDPVVLSELIKRNVWLKASVVEQDEKESGRRACLNLGHTAGHALEAVLGYGTVSHGQAVALGLLVALAASEEVLGLEKEVRERTDALLSQFGMSTRLDLPPAATIMAAAEHDKKATSASSGFVGLRSIGEPIWGLDLPAEVFARALEVIRA